MAPVDIPIRRITPRSTRPTRPRSAGALVLTDRPTRFHLTSERPSKRRKYIPGGPGGGGRYIDETGQEVAVGGTGPGGYNYIGPRGRVGRENAANGLVPIVYPSRRDRSTRPTTAATRTVLPRAEQPPMRFSSAAQAAAVVQSDGYKPREEKTWEEFHPSLEIDAGLRAVTIPELEGLVASRPGTPASSRRSPSEVVITNGASTPNGVEGKLKDDEGLTPTGSQNGDQGALVRIPGTPGGGKRRPGRPPKNPVDFYTRKAAALGKGLNTGTPRSPKIVAVQNTTAKERLTLPQPSFRKTNTLARFDEKALGYGKYVEKSMQNVGYQESDEYILPFERYVKADDGTVEDDLDFAPGCKSDGESIVAIGSGVVGRVEYDMDEQDDRWLQAYNAERKAASFEGLSRELLEITLTKIEKEWHSLEKRIPKPNPKPPQTHRPRSSSAAAVNGEPQPGEEQDSKCAICDDGDCENTNAIVFCDGCDLAVHQECYGVPFIPEGQWLCRKCQLIGRGIPTCIFCPNTDGAFKQTNASKWAHLLCAMWIPEVSLGNHTFMEPVMDVEKVPKTRWKLRCYLCQQQMGACIQCGNKACYQAFHVTCARKARLFLKMKNSHGTLAVLDGTTVLKAFCDKHCPSEYTKENDVAGATRDARLFYKKTMRGRLWADSQQSALALAATHRHAVTEHQPNESQLTGANVFQAFNDSKKKANDLAKPIWKLPSGAPVIPQVLYNSVESSLQRFTVRKRKEFAADACRYWTLKREARRGAALLKRLQLSMETFSSMEITRRNFSGMGPSGLEKLNRRIEFAQTLIKDLDHLRGLSQGIMDRETLKLQLAKAGEDRVDTIYFPLASHLLPILERAAQLDIKDAFTAGLTKVQVRVESRFYVTAMAFAQDFSAVFSDGLARVAYRSEALDEDQVSPSKKAALDLKDRKRLAKRIIKAVQPALTSAVRAEADIINKPIDEEIKELEAILETGLEARHIDNAAAHLGVGIALGEPEYDIDMPDASPTRVNGHRSQRRMMKPVVEGDSIDVAMPDAAFENDTVTVATSGLSNGDQTLSELTNNVIKSSFTNGNKSANTPPDTNGNGSTPENNQPAPPTPPVSTGDVAPTDSAADTLTNGGIPWYIKDFQPDGTNVLEENPPDQDAMSEELSDMDDDELKGLGVEFEESESAGPKKIVAKTGAPPRTKKGRVKKRWRGYR